MIPATCYIVPISASRVAETSFTAETLPMMAMKIPNVPRCRLMAAKSFPPTGDRPQPPPWYLHIPHLSLSWPRSHVENSNHDTPQDTHNSHQCIVAPAALHTDSVLTGLGMEVEHLSFSAMPCSFRVGLLGSSLYHTFYRLG